MQINIKPRLNQAGFSLIEIMVGLVIGMLATLVIVQVMSVFESQKRSTTGTADAQTNGGIALYNIGRELQFSGYPLMPMGLAGVADSALECTIVTYGATGITSFSPVTITNGTAVSGVSSASDTIAIRYGDSAGGGVPSPIGALSGNILTLNSNFACQVGDVTLITNNATCAMSHVTVVSSATTKQVTLQNATAAVAGADVSCMGNWHTVTYSVVGANLQRADQVVRGSATTSTITTDTQDNVADIVNIQAQYGVSTTVDSNQVNAWVDATGVWAPAALAAAPATRNRIKAIRIAVVARNPKIEPAAVSTLCSAVNVAAPTGLCAWAGVAVGGAITIASPAPTLSLSDGDANWARYRYRVYETVIPLRNMIWARETL